MSLVLAPVAAVEASVDAGVIGVLANCTASIAGAPSVGGIFDREYAQANVGDYGMASTAPALTVQRAVVPVQPYGLVVVIDATAALEDRGRYIVREARPDGGLIVLLLELAP
ncbi:hypothetical protein [uncultured Xylophilus sp.]|uniref:head-tail joining protein n=1 Tax=uncultured Xylophilus sp. TaxID=296832 RepID=UPI0025F462A5|nr:hypothetical protein [uncultured Xylophilus sp.]